MIRVHGPYNFVREGIADGTPLRDKNGVPWHPYVMSRVRFDEAGRVIEFFEDDGETPIVVGTRRFGLVIATDPTSEIHFVTIDMSAAEPFERFVVETDEPMEAGMRFVESKILPPLPEPYVPVSISADALFLSMTDEEYDDLDASVKAGESARVYRSWGAAQSFTEGTDLWTLLVKHLSFVVSTERKAELLTRS